MVSRFSKTLSGVVLCASLLTCQPAFANCGPGDAPDATCLPNTFQKTQNLLQQQQEDRDRAAADQKRMMEQNEAAAAAADPRNQNDSNSPYYGPRQCEAARNSIPCTLGISCSPPNIDCSQFEPKPVARHHRANHHF